MDTNAAECSRAGASAAKIAAVSAWTESALFDAGERAALALAEAMSRTPAEVTDGVFEAVRKHFTDEQLVELAASIAMENYRARFNRTFGVESIDTYRP